MFHPENEELKQNALSVLEFCNNGRFEVEVEFPGFDHIHIEKIEAFSILQDFSNKIFDIVGLTIAFIPEQALELVKSYQDLKCSLTFYRTHRTSGARLLGEEPIQFEYNVLIVNPDDLLKKLNSREFLQPKKQPDTEQYQPVMVPIQMSLIDEAVYELKHQEMTGNWIDVTAEDMIRFTATTFGFNEIELVTPDNDAEKEQFTMPPSFGFASAFHFIQDRIGVYNYDLALYILDGKLHVYPRNENEPAEPIAPGTVHIYKIGTDMYVGSHGYMRIDGDDIHCICNKPVEMQDLSEKNTEIVGNALVVKKADMALDTNRDIIEDGIDQKEEKAVTVMNPNSNTAVSGVQNAKYVESQDNMQKLTSMMSEHDCVLGTVDVQHVDPMIILPNHPCVFHYEDDGIYKSVNGSIIGCTYTLALDGRTGPYLYRFDVRMALRLTPERKDNIAQRAAAAAAAES